MKYGVKITENPGRLCAYYLPPQKKPPERLQFLLLPPYVGGKERFTYLPLQHRDADVNQAQAVGGEQEVVIPVSRLVGGAQQVAVDEAGRVQGAQLVGENAQP